MLQINQMPGKRKYDLIHNDGSTETIISNLSLVAHSVSNKFYIIGDLVSEMCEQIDGFEDWYLYMIKSYQSSSYNTDILMSNTDKFLEFSEKYLDYKNIDFDSFINLEKKSKTSIVFYPKDIKSIAISSTALKLLSLFSCDEVMHLPDNVYKSLYEKLIQPCKDSDVTTKVFQLIRSRTYRSSVTDRYMWDFIRMMISETPESYVMTVFNFLMKSILILINVDQNPVPFLISTIDDSIRWLMRSVFKDRIIYGEVFGGVDDLFGSALTKENFYLFCCQDVIGKAAAVGMTILEEKDLTDGEFQAVVDRLDGINHIHHSALLVILPIASKVFEVPYHFLLTIPPKHAMLLGVFLHEISKDIFGERFPVLYEFLLSSPRLDNQSKESTIVKSSYKMRNLELVLNDTNLFFGFASPTLKFDIMSSITGILSASKRVLVNLVTGKQLSKITYYSLESDVCGFYNEFYANKLDSMFDKLRDKADTYF